MSNLNNTIGENIRIALAKQGKTQTELALVLGIGKNAISAITNGTRPLTAMQLFQVATFFGTTTDWLVEEHMPEIRAKAA